MHMKQVYKPEFPKCYIFMKGTVPHLLEGWGSGQQVMRGTGRWHKTFLGGDLAYRKTVHIYL